MRLLLLAIDAYSLIVFVAIIVSWIPDAQNNAAARWLDKVTEPALAPIRKIVPSIGGFDVSAMILLVGLHFLKRLIVLL